MSDERTPTEVVHDAEDRAGGGFGPVITELLAALIVELDRRYK